MIRSFIVRLRETMRMLRQMQFATWRLVLLGERKLRLNILGPVCYMSLDSDYVTGYKRAVKDEIVVVRYDDWWLTRERLIHIHVTTGAQWWDEAVLWIVICEECTTTVIWDTVKVVGNRKGCLNVLYCLSCVRTELVTFNIKETIMGHFSLLKVWRKILCYRSVMSFR